MIGLQLVSGQAVPTVRSAPTAQNVVRTADTAVRGLKESDFPRITKVGDNVYVYEALHPNYKNFSVNSLIVVTTDGVLIADAQQTPEMVTEMMATIAKITSQPIKYVVICADHIDHVGGDAAFPSSVKFVVHPFSKATLDRQTSNPNFPRIPTSHRDHDDRQEGAEDGRDRNRCALSGPSAHRRRPRGVSPAARASSS